MCQVGEKFLWTELSKTSNMDQQLSDSAGTATAFLEGMKRHAKILPGSGLIRMSSISLQPSFLFIRGAGTYSEVRLVQYFSLCKL